MQTRLAGTKHHVHIAASPALVAGQAPSPRARPPSFVQPLRATHPYTEAMPRVTSY